MKKSNWREDLYAPVAVKKVLKEFIQSLPLVATNTIVPFTTTAKAVGAKGFFSTTPGKLTTGATVGHAVGTATQERDRNRRYPGVPRTGHHIGRRQNPR